MKVTYHILSGPSLKEVAEAWDGVPFNPFLAVAWVAKDEDGKIVDMVVIHSLPILEGLHMVDPKVGLTLIKKAKDWLEQAKAKRVLFHTANPTLAAMMEDDGAEKCAEQMYEWGAGRK